jgi:hypothetical protein
MIWNVIFLNSCIGKLYYWFTIQNTAAKLQIKKRSNLWFWNVKSNWSHINSSIMSQHIKLLRFVNQSWKSGLASLKCSPQNQPAHHKLKHLFVLIFSLTFTQQTFKTVTPTSPPYGFPTLQYNHCLFKHKNGTWLTPFEYLKPIGNCTENDRKYAKFTAVIKCPRQPDTFRDV